MIPLAPKFWRRMVLHQLSRTTPDRLRSLGERRLLAAFRRAASGSPAYARILSEHGVDAAWIDTVEAFVARAPVLDKRSTFERFPLEALWMPGTAGRLAGVLTSSGQGGSFAFGLITHAQATGAPAGIDLGLQRAFDVDRRKTLLINCLPMGVRFHSNAVTVADVSVREDMAVALMRGFAAHFAQIILVMDPLFAKRLLDHAEETGFELRDHRIHAILGEETFGERFRSHLCERLGVDPEDRRSAFVGSSMGVGELGLNLFFETRETVALRRMLDRDASARARFLGSGDPADPPPLVFACNPLRTFVEVLEPDEHGFGDLAISMVEADTALPLMRYRTGDVARLLADDEVEALCRLAGERVKPPPFPLVAVAGRRKDRLPNGRSVLGYKDGLYRDPAIAARITGALRLGWRASGVHADVQLRRGAEAPVGFETAVARALARSGETMTVRSWPFAEFPYGMNLDYERKFAYYRPEDVAPTAT